MNDIRDAKPHDVYADAKGNLWRVIGVCGEPTVILQEIEPDADIEPIQLSGGISGQMWQGFRRILRPG